MTSCLEKGSLFHTLQHFGRRTHQLWTDDIFQRLLLKSLDLFETRPLRVQYCNGSWQDKFDTMHKQGVEFFEGVPTQDDLKNGLVINKEEFLSWTISR